MNLCCVLGGPRCEDPGYPGGCFFHSLRTWRDTAIESDQAYIFTFGSKLKVPRMERLPVTDYVEFAKASDRHVVGVLREAVIAPVGRPEISK